MAKSNGQSFTLSAGPSLVLAVLPTVGTMGCPLTDCSRSPFAILCVVNRGRGALSELEEFPRGGGGVLIHLAIPLGDFATKATKTTSRVDDHSPECNRPDGIAPLPSLDAVHFSPCLLNPLFLSSYKVSIQEAFIIVADVKRRKSVCLLDVY